MVCRYFNYLIVLVFVLLNSNANAGDNVCSKELFSLYKKYRYDISIKDNYDSVERIKKYFDIDYFEKVVKNNLKRNYFYRLFINEKVNGEVEKHIRRFNDVELNYIVVDEYYGICTENRGELYMNMITADSRYINEALLFVKKENNWVLTIEEFLEPKKTGSSEMIYFGKALVEQNVLHCFSSLSKSDLYYRDREQYVDFIKSCYF